MVTKTLCIAASLCLFAGCAPADSTGGETDDDTAAAAMGSPTPVTALPASDAATTVKVKNGVTLDMHTALTWRTNAAGAEELVLHGSTSQDIVFVQGFIPDDSFGTANQLGPRSFELVFDNGSDFTTVMVGERFFLELTTKTVAGNHDFSAEFVVEPRLVPTASGTSRLTLADAVTPTYVTTAENGISYRGTLTTTSTPQNLTVTSAGPGPALTQDAPHAWHFDWSGFASFNAALQSKQPVEAKAKFGATTSKRDATLELRLKEVGLAAGSISPDDYWDLPECDPNVQACVAAQPAGTTDFGKCGDYLAIQICSF